MATSTAYLAITFTLGDWSHVRAFAKLGRGNVATSCAMCEVAPVSQLKKYTLV